VAPLVDALPCPASPDSPLTLDALGQAVLGTRRPLFQELERLAGAGIGQEGAADATEPPGTRSGQPARRNRDKRHCRRHGSSLGVLGRFALASDLDTTARCPKAWAGP
jgi:hypothetical protein